jgi:hypothetical protein
MKAVTKRVIVRPVRVCRCRLSQLAILAVFFAGMALGSFLFAYKSEPLQIASNDATTATSVPNGAPPTTLR